MTIELPKPSVTNYSLWKKTDDGWVVISGVGKKRKSGRPSKPRVGMYYYTVQGKTYNTMREAMDTTGLTSDRIRYMCNAPKFKDSYKKRK